MDFLLLNFFYDSCSFLVKSDLNFVSGLIDFSEFVTVVKFSGKVRKSLRDRRFNIVVDFVSLGKLMRRKSKIDEFR